MPSIIYHLAFRTDWEAGLASGEYRAPSLADEGFIHASGDEEQMLRVAARLFAGRTDLLALDVDTERLPNDSPVIREPARSGEMYPHVYGPIIPDAVVQVRALVPDADNPGFFTLTDAG
ncbi:MAG: DUF952 domain-containing protein [Chloroflexi bacterium]|nr:DUF952 domain-containing protein [Chloroflexota bacterium]